LKSVAEALAQCLGREDDFVARYGGEEFVAVLPNTDEKGAYVLADRILERMRERDIPHEESEIAPYVTISIGGTTISPESVHYNSADADYLKRADDALYVSKQSGRNRYTHMNHN
jgi:diguanylate cyclase (GGDEF)-like protein